MKSVLEFVTKAFSSPIEIINPEAAPDYHVDVCYVNGRSEAEIVMPQVLVEYVLPDKRPYFQQVGCFSRFGRAGDEITFRGELLAGKTLEDLAVAIDAKLASFLSPESIVSNTRILG